MDDFSIWTVLEEYNKRTKVRQIINLPTDQQLMELKVAAEEEIQKEPREDNLFESLLTEEKKYGKTPHGGVYSVVKYLNGASMPVANLTRRKCFVWNLIKTAELFTPSLCIL